MVTEDHYIDYLSSGPIESLIPVHILGKLSVAEITMRRDIEQAESGETNAAHAQMIALDSLAVNFALQGKIADRLRGGAVLIEQTVAPTSPIPLPSARGLRQRRGRTHRPSRR